MTDTAIVPAQTQAPIATPRFSQAHLDIIKRLIMPNGNQTEFEAFIWVAAQYDLNPIKNQIYPMPIEGRHIPVVSTQTYYDWAKQAGFRGWKDETITVVDKGDKDKTVQRIKPDEFKHDQHELIGASVRIQIEGEDEPRDPTTVLYKEYARKKRDGSIMSTWRNNPVQFLMKCCKRKAIKENCQVDDIATPDDAHMYVDIAALPMTDQPEPILPESEKKADKSKKLEPQTPTSVWDRFRAYVKQISTADKDIQEGIDQVRVLVLEMFGVEKLTDIEEEKTTELEQWLNKSARPYLQTEGYIKRAGQ